ncbi:MAG: WYL domain-containing protein [Candidatus Caccosoma sp.]|nr:WYL domain-containing protein [Candidatus Caccosoma sp.]
MAEFEAKKLTILRILDILKEYSDYEHPLKHEDIINYLSILYDIDIDRKTVGRNITYLKDAGYEITSTRKGSYLEVRDFDDSELHMLIDGVLSSKYITATHSKDLIERICNLSNKYFKASVKHIYSVNEWSKTDNQDVFYNIELIDEAIEKKCQIAYEYNKYGIDKKLHKSSYQYVSPYQMILHNQHYYLMAYSEYWKNIVFHRLDHISNMVIKEDKNATSLKSIKGYENGIDYKQFSQSMPYMFADKIETIYFDANISIIDQIIDWFGNDIKINKDENDEKLIHVEVKASQTAMYYWAIQYVNYVKVTYPTALKEKIKESLIKAIEKY